MWAHVDVYAILVDRMPFSNWHRCGAGVVCSTVVYPGAVAYETAGAYGGPERCDDHGWPGDRVRHGSVTPHCTHQSNTTG